MHISNPGDVFYAEQTHTNLTGDLLNQDSEVGTIFCHCLCFSKALNFNALPKRSTDLTTDLVCVTLSPCSSATLPGCVAAQR